MAFHFGRLSFRYKMTHVKSHIAIAESLLGRDHSDAHLRVSSIADLIICCFGVSTSYRPRVLLVEKHQYELWNDIV